MSGPRWLPGDAGSVASGVKDEGTSRDENDFPFTIASNCPCS